MKKILIVTTTSNSIINFRYSLIESLIERDFEIHIACNDDNRISEVDKLDIHFYNLKYNNRNKNPFNILIYMRKIRKIINNINPQILFTFQLQPNLFGQLVAKQLKISRFAMVEGLGDTFSDGFIWKCINFPIRSILKYANIGTKKVFLLNDEDKQYLLEKKIFQKCQISLINGIGVDINKFYYSKKNVDTISFLMLSRLFERKGLFIYLEAAKKVKMLNPSIKFVLVGKTNHKNLAIINQYVDENIIDYYHYTNNPMDFHRKHSVFVLPSFYNEGLPMSIMEAMSVGTAIITTNNRGCNQTVKNNFNGYMIPTKSVDELVTAMNKLIKNPELINQFGKNSRSLAEDKFDQKKINDLIINTIMKEHGDAL
jgi:glycosyltransferase involved in cell wall biosynthesis